MKGIVTQNTPGAIPLRKSGISAKLWPNGELSIYIHHQQKKPSATPNPVVSLTLLRDALVRSAGVRQTLQAFDLLGLSHPRNFDKNHATLIRKGLKGITGLGKRRVRNGSYIMTRENGKDRLTFATVTLPSLTPLQLSRVHKDWHRCIDFYRREISRALIARGLTGEIVGVSEIQEKRYATSHLPVLHGHFVFVGAGRRGGWAITPRKHDDIWRRALESVLDEPIGSINSACQLKSVTESAEAYLGKYMSKGTKAVAAVVRQGFGEWMPKQWWSCSRSLTQRMETAIARFESGALWLFNKAQTAGCDLFTHIHPIQIEHDGKMVNFGYFGRLTPKSNGLIRKVLNLEPVVLLRPT